MKGLLQSGVAIAGLALAMPAVADGAERTAAPSAARASATAAPANASATPAVAPRIRASHRVDVIGPGEKVDTVIDRLRASRAATDVRGAAPRSGEARGAEQAGPPGAEGRREGERSGVEGPRGPGGGALPGSGPPAQGDRPHR